MDPAGPAAAPDAKRRFALSRSWTVVALCAVAVMAWPYHALIPGVGGDWTWKAALSIAVTRGLHFGQEIVWTYGPLGFMNFGPGPSYYYGGLAFVALAYQWILQLLLTATVFLAARRSYPVFASLGLAFAVVAVVRDRALLLGLAWCMLAILYGSERREAPGERWFPAAIGVLTGFLILAKLNQGAEMVALAGIALAARPGARWRDGLVFAASALSIAAVGWFGTGQAVGAIWDYIRYSAQIVGGYAAAMGTSAERGWTYLLALALFLLTSAVVWNAARFTAGRQRFGVITVWLVSAFFAFKAGFVRGIVEHTTIFTGNALMVLAVIPVRRPVRTFGFVSVIACAAAFVIPSYVTIESAFDPIAHVKNAAKQVETLASKSKRTAARASLAAAIESYYRFPASLRQRIGDRSVAFWPSSFADLAYADDFDWRPLPVIESYSAYTPSLDELDAAALASKDAPELIVRNPSGLIDARYSSFEAPAATLQLLCRYQEMARNGSWQLLARGPDRCGSPRQVGTASATWGGVVHVPSPRNSNAAMLVEVSGVQPAGLERVTQVLLRPQARYIVLDGQAYRLVGATAPDGLLLSLPARADFPPPFDMAPDPATIAVVRGGDSEAAEALRFEFSEVPIRPENAGGRARSPIVRPQPGAVNRSISVKPGAVKGYADNVSVAGQILWIGGWAVSGDFRQPAREILGRVKGSAISVVEPDELRPDVAEHEHRRSLLHSGFSFQVLISELDCSAPAGGLELLGVIGSTATPLDWLPGTKQAIGNAC